MLYATATDWLEQNTRINVTQYNKNCRPPGQDILRLSWKET
jgi:hypothetical protein